MVDQNVKALNRERVTTIEILFFDQIRIDVEHEVNLADSRTKVIQLLKLKWLHFRVKMTFICLSSVISFKLFQPVLITVNCYRVEADFASKRLR